MTQPEPEPTVEQKLATLDGLHADGVIDDAEYGRLREWILSGRPTP